MEIPYWHLDLGSKEYLEVSVGTSRALKPLKIINQKQYILAHQNMSYFKKVLPKLPIVDYTVNSWDS